MNFPFIASVCLCYTPAPSFLVTPDHLKAPSLLPSNPSQPPTHTHAPPYLLQSMREELGAASHATPALEAHKEELLDRLRALRSSYKEQLRLK